MSKKINLKVYAHEFVSDPARPNFSNQMVDSSNAYNALSTRLIPHGKMIKKKFDKLSDEQRKRLSEDRVKSSVTKSI